jgi:monothiol glutaredoxin
MSATEQGKGDMKDDLTQRIESTINQHRVMLFMKGSPSMPQCGFSAAVVQILKQVGAPFGSYNILADPELREGLKQYASWPTYPQLYVEGKLLGGADIVREMHARGELAPLLAPANPTA